MQGADLATEAAAAWFVEPDRVPARRRRTRRLERLRRSGDLTSLRAAIVSSFFLVLLATSLLLGGHAAIDPLLRMAIDARDGRSVGKIVLAMPDGKFCRHMTFDNDTAEVLEGAIERCPDGIINEHFRSRAAGNFAWAQR